MFIPEERKSLHVNAEDPRPIPEAMRAAILVGPEAIEIREVPVPRPGPGEILLRIGAATTCGTDVKVYRRGGHPRMLRVPTPFGHEMAGTIAAVGGGVDLFSIGERVVVANSAPCESCPACRAQRENLCEDLHYLNGAFADYLLVPERFVRLNTHRLPAGIDFAKAALTEPLACVLHGLDGCALRQYSRDGSAVEVIVYGAGPIGLLFVAALARDGQQVILADPNPARLAIGKALGAARQVLIERGGAQAATVRALTSGGRGAQVAIDATGLPEVWHDAIASVRPGGLVNLFGGCAPGTEVALDAHLVHYSEITVKGVYHHRPPTVRAALQMLAEPEFRAELLISGSCAVHEVEDALQRMIRKEALKVAVLPG